MKRYRIKTAGASMPASCWGTYRRIAIVELEPGHDDVARIDARAKGCARIVATWERLSVGKTERCAYARAMREAEAFLGSLEGEDR